MPDMNAVAPALDAKDSEKSIVKKDGEGLITYKVWREGEKIRQRFKISPSVRDVVIPSWRDARTTTLNCGIVVYVPESVVWCPSGNAMAAGVMVEGRVCTWDKLSSAYLPMANDLSYLRIVDAYADGGVVMEQVSRAPVSRDLMREVADNVKRTMTEVLRQYARPFAACVEIRAGEVGAL